MPSLPSRRLDAVDEGAHQRLRGRIHLDLPAVVERHDRLDLAPELAQDEIEHILGALDHVGVRVFLVADDDVGGAHALQRHVAVRIELDADHAVLADDGACPLDDVALHVVVAVGDHGAVQSEQHAVDRQGGLQLAQDLVAHELVVGPVGGAGRAGGEAAALDQREPLGGGTPAGDEQRGRAHARGIGGVLAGSEEHAFLVGGEAGRQGREGVGLGGERGGEQAHGALRGRARQSSI